MMHLEKVLWLAMIGLYVYVCVWIYYIMPSILSNDIGGPESVDVLDEDELTFAYILIRHGHRTPKETYNTDPYNASFWRFNQLTSLGKRTQYELGKFLRQQYDKLIGPSGYSSQKVHIQSTDEDRCLISAQANAAGLFPPQANDVWNDELYDWQPIPVHTVENQRNCGKVKRLTREYLESDEIKALLSEHSQLRFFLEEHSNTSVKIVDDFIPFNDALNVERSYGLRLPEWAEKVLNEYGDVLEYFTAIKYECFTHTKELKKIKGGFLIKSIFDQLKNRSLNISTPKNMLIDFTHGHTIVNILNTLNVYELHVPPFTCSLHFHLYKNGSGEYYVKLFYRRDGFDGLPFIEFPDCGSTKCSLDKLYQLYGDVIPKENETLSSLCRS